MIISFPKFIRNIDIVSNISPKRLNPDIIDSESHTKRMFYLCPHCLNVYSARVNTSIFYDDPINRSLEGIVTRTKYFCKSCGDYAFDVDEKIIKTVKLLISNGFHTVSSCSGHSEKKDQFDFMYEGGMLYVTDNLQTYGACVSIRPFDENEERIKNRAFKLAFDSIKTEKAYGQTIIVLEPDEQSKNYFFIAPVNDVKSFRRAGESRREAMIDQANKNLYNFVANFIDKFNISIGNIDRRDSYYN